MPVRPPADGIVALRSLGRRWRGLFAGLDEDESPDALAHRPGSNGRSALDHATHATRTLSLLGRALEQVMVDDDAILHPAVADPTEREWPPSGAGVDEAIDELAHEAEQLAARAGRVTAHEWDRRRPVAGGSGEVNAMAVLWDAVDTAIADLKAAEATLREVRGRP